MEGEITRLRLLTLKEASEILNVHINTLRRWDREGIIRTVRLPNGYRRIPESEIHRILNGKGEDRGGDNHD
jgi:excisionase family DNA binding protein